MWILLKKIEPTLDSKRSAAYANVPIDIYIT